jgi:hypothetical protein
LQTARLARTVLNAFEKLIISPFEAVRAFGVADEPT